MRLGVTGASGYLGGALVALANARGLEVVALGRRAAPGCAQWRACDLAQAPPADLLDGLDAVVHLAAWTGQGAGVDAAREIAFSVALAQAAARRGLPCVISSSQAASPTAPSDYGRTKAAIEAATLPLGAILLRPGLVVGGREQGLFGLLCTLVRRLPLLPHLLPSPRVQPVHVQDVARALLAACARPALAGRVVAVAGPPMRFERLLAMIARERVRKRRAWLPVPVALLRLALALASPLTGARLSPARLDSLLSLPPLDPDEAARLLEVPLRSPAATLDRRGRDTRAFLREADALARALLGQPPPPRLLRRYVRLLPRQGVQAPLDLAPALLARPRRLAALDAPARRRSAERGSLAWRLDAMTRLAEAEPALATRFLALPGHAGRWRAGCDIARATLVELGLRLLAPLARARRGVD